MQDKIYYFSQVCKVADVYESLTSPLVYRRAMKSYDALTLMTRNMKSMFDPKVLRNFISLLTQPHPPPSKQSIDNNSITEKPAKNRVILLSLSMVFQPKKLILIWVFPANMLKWVIILSQFGKAVPESFGMSFVAWAM